jgi:hypothetical protein
LLHGLTPEERDTYTAIINDIIARHDNTIISSDCILEFLREKNKLALTQQRHHLHMLIIECLKTRPTPLTHARGVGTGLGVNGTQAHRQLTEAAETASLAAWERLAKVLRMGQEQQPNYGCRPFVKSSSSVILA